MDELDSSAMEDLDADVDAGEDLNQSPCVVVKDSLAALREEPALSRRSWTDDKFCTYNMIAKHKRRLGLV